MSRSGVARTFVLLMALYGHALPAQEVKDTLTRSFSDSILNYDLGRVLMADSIYGDNGTHKYKRDEPLGFIGSDYERLRIHFTAVIKDPYYPNEYFVFGKTLVKQVTCLFQGTIFIHSARIRSTDPASGCRTGYIISEVVLSEYKTQTSSGLMRGRLVSNFMIDRNGTFRYDDLLFGADAFRNNQFSGKWTSYKTGASLTCNWGDYRIPGCGDLDMGTGCFSPADAYLQNGWQSYRDAWFVDENDPVAREAQGEETREWWK
jgi:hypothetical protein